MKCQKILDYIIEYKQANNGLSPSYRDIMKSCGLLSTSHVQYILKKLDKDGKIILLGKISRGIKVIGGKWSYEEL